MRRLHDVLTPLVLLVSICVMVLVATQRVVASEHQLAGNVAFFKWAHGSEDCEATAEPSIQVLTTSARSFILRQSKCSSFEAPFMYLLIGDERALLLDTGDSKDPTEFPLFATVAKLLSENTDATRQLIVLHSHGHLDHKKGDAQFAGVDSVELVGSSLEELISRFKLEDWPQQTAVIDLGGRMLTLIPSPGHHEAAISIFDHETGWLLTGDTVYPGSLRVSEWQDYRQSIRALTDFSANNDVSFILGGHIEMKANSQGLYRLGSTYQPNELPLAISVGELRALDVRLQVEQKSTKLKFEKFVISPLNWLEKKLSKAAKAMTNN